MPRAESRTGHTVVPFSNFQHQMIDWMELMRRQHTTHGLLEIDVTDARRAIHERRVVTGEPLSFSAFIIASLARAIAEDKRMQAYRKGRNRLILFDDVDVALAVEHELEDERVPLGYVIRAADKKDVAEIDREIRRAKSEPPAWVRWVRWLPLWLWVPAFLRRWLLTMLLRDPRRRKRLAGTVIVTAVGMFGSGTGWGVPLTDYPLCLTVGGVARKPGMVHEHDGGKGERIEVREILSLTISMDHDVIDGAPAARFARRLTELIESGAVLKAGRINDGSHPGEVPICMTDVD